MDKPPYLTLVDPKAPSKLDEYEQEFLPLPFYPWNERPAHLPLDHDEVATAIHLSDGDLVGAAEKLKVPIVRVTRSLRASPRLQRVRSEALDINVEKAIHNVVESLDAVTSSGDPHVARREWASTKVLQSRLMMGAPLSPAPASSIQSNASLTLNPQSRTVTFRWRTAADALTAEEKDDGA